jgi:hypothetical protein
MSYFKTKCNYPTQDEKGNPKVEAFIGLFDGANYTDAENQAYEYMLREYGNDFIIDTITKVKINEIFEHEEADKVTWFKAKVAYIVFDEKSQKEKKVPFVFLLNASDVKEANGILLSKLGTVQDYVILDITTTNIQEVVAPQPPKGE